MCGIAGVIAFNDSGREYLKKIDGGIQCLVNRGPDARGAFVNSDVAFGQTRLSIIDVSEAANQPMTDASGRYTIIFNGEFFNFREHRQHVLDAGYNLKTDSDTEVLLYLYIMEGEQCLERVNGFFALAIYDDLEKTAFIARDRIGVKPLLMSADPDKLLFASEMKSLVSMGAEQNMDSTSLLMYLQLNYIPAPATIYSTVHKLLPGHYLKFKINGERDLSPRPYYSIPYIRGHYTTTTYSQQKERMVELMDEAVQRRLVADVPVGAFLSGGIDSSVVVALAARHTPKLQTFSIGFRDEPMFDETRYASLVARKYHTDHHVFSLTTDDLYANLQEMLDYIDEPFADSSALNVFLLSKETRKKVKVALSGDGADELFGGYYKHVAELQYQKKGILQKTIQLLHPFWKQMPQSRNTPVGNTVRQLNRFAEGAKLSAQERYWRWAIIENEINANDLLIGQHIDDEYQRRKNEYLRNISEDDLNDVLYTDTHLVLPNDMLVKTDMMSMANSLEIRNPFLDFTVADFAFSLPASSKIKGTFTKRIIRDAFRHLLPPEIYSRKKQGFEVPLLKWFRTELKSVITDELLSDDFIHDQNLFNPPAVRQLLKQLYSRNPADSVARVWALIVFQNWWKKYASHR